MTKAQVVTVEWTEEGGARYCSRVEQADGSWAGQWLQCETARVSWHARLRWQERVALPHALLERACTAAVVLPRRVAIDLELVDNRSGESRVTSQGQPKSRVAVTSSAVLVMAPSSRTIVTVWALPVEALAAVLVWLLTRECVR